MAVTSGMESNLLNQGVMLMIVGMGTVFVFLTVLVIAMTLMSRLVARFQPTLEVTGTGDDEIAAIVAAIAEHRRQ